MSYVCEQFYEDQMFDSACLKTVVQEIKILIRCLLAT